MLDCHWSFDVHTLVPRKSWWLAILVSLRHDSSSLDVPLAHRKRTTKDNCHGDFTLRRFGRDQRNRYLAVFVDRQDSTIARMSGREPRHLRVNLCKEMRACLTKRTERLRFAPMPAGPKPRLKMGAGGNQ